MMDRVIAIRAACLYVPMLMTAALAMRREPQRRLFAACLVGLMWVLPALLALQLLNLHFGWWSFHASSGLFRGMPVDMYLGWALLWGVLPMLAAADARVEIIIAAALGIDLLAMPACWPVLELHHHWLIGEAAAVALVLVPAQLFSRWTYRDTCLRGRALSHVLSSAGLLMFVVPEAAWAFMHAGSWSGLLAQPGWALSLEAQLIAVLGLPSVAALQEFAQRGGGTPIPYDPPKRLVTSGLYRYIANPMQLSCSLVLTAWGAILRDPWVMAAAIISFVYGVGLANWHESVDIGQRFGERWLRYRGRVRPWRFRWKPYVDADAAVAIVYIAEQCGPCAAVRRWFEAHNARGLHVVAAEDHPGADLQRITYEPGDGTPPEEGVAAFARALEHVDLGWAIVGALIRLPGLRGVLQLLADASGFGPRVIRRRKVCEVSLGD